MVSIQCLCLECSAANEEITVQSKVFVSERYSSLFHQAFCRHLLTAPKKISYIECDRLHLNPCPICIPSSLDHRLIVDLKEFRYEQQQREIRAELAKKRRTEAVVLEYQRRQAVRLQQEQEARLREIDRRQRQADRIRLAAEKEQQKQELLLLEQKRLHQLHQQHSVDVENIKQRLKDIQVVLNVKNISGFTLPMDLFYTHVHIVGNLDFPLDKHTISYGYTVHCRDSRYLYSISDGEDSLSYLSKNNVTAVTVTVTGKQFFETEKTIILEDDCFKVAVHEINFASELFIDLSIRNKTMTEQTIQKLEFEIDDVEYHFTLKSPITLPTKATASHLKGALSPALPNAQRAKIFEKLSHPLVYSDLLSRRNDLDIALSICCSHDNGDPEGELEFYQRFDVVLNDLFYE